MRFFEASIGTVVIRFYLMMGVVIVSLFAGFPWGAILALPIFLSAMLGISYKKTVEPRNVNNEKNQRKVVVSNIEQAA